MMKSFLTALTLSASMWALTCGAPAQLMPPNPGCQASIDVAKGAVDAAKSALDLAHKLCVGTTPPPIEPPPIEGGGPPPGGGEGGGPPPSGEDPTVGLVPPASNGWANWKHAGAGEIPVRHIIFRTLTPNGTDDTKQINDALAACPADQVVKLTAGVFRITGNGVNFTTSDCTLRGVGPGKQLNTGVNKVNGGGTARNCAAGSTMMTFRDALCADPAATQLVKADRDTNGNYGTIYMHGGGGFLPSINFAQDAAQGATSITLASAPPVKAGDIVLIDEVTNTVPEVVYGPSFGPPGDGSRRWFMRQDRSLSQLVEVTGVNGATITFNSPLTYTFKREFQAQLTPYSTPFLRHAGIEDLFVWGGAGGDYHGNIAVSNCAYCWVKNVEASWSVGTNIGFYSTFRSTLRDSFMHETPDANPGGAGYQSGMNVSATENLFENNIMWYGNKEIVSRADGGGNVVAYNYMDDAFGQSYPQSAEAGVNVGHYTTPHLDLIEGNYSQSYSGDAYWGNSIHITVMRNWFSGLRAGHPPLHDYIAVISGCHYPYLDIQGRTAVGVQAYSYATTFIGNVLGMKDQKLILNPYGDESCFTRGQEQFVEQVTTKAEDDANKNKTGVPMWLFGPYQATVNTGEGWTYVDSTIDTQTRIANWDWFTKSIRCFGTGGRTPTGGPDGACEATRIPQSFYLTAKPAFFGSNQWPWVDPFTGETFTLPAKACFEQGKMPTCMQ